MLIQDYSQSCFRLVISTDVHITEDLEIVMFHDPHLGTYQLRLLDYCKQTPNFNYGMPPQKKKIEQPTGPDEFKRKSILESSIN